MPGAGKLRKTKQPEAVSLAALPPLKPAVPAVWSGEERRKQDQVHTLINELHKLIEINRNERIFLETVIRQMPAAVIIVDAPSGRLRMGNELVEKIFRGQFRASKKIADYNEWKLFHLDGRPYGPEETPMARAIVRGESVFNEEMRILRDDGSERFLSANASPLLDSKGKIVAGVVAFVDVTERKQLEQSLSRNRQRLDLLQKAAQVGYWEVDVETETTVWSDEMFKMLGRDPVSFKPDYRRGLELVHPDDRERVAQAVRTAIEQKTRIQAQCRILRPDGGLRFLLIRGQIFYDQAKHLRMLGVAMDVTAQKQRK